MKLNCENAEELVYINTILEISVLGGLKLEGLDRMRVTVRISVVENSAPPIRHNLDLYNDTQVEKLIRKIAERLEIGTSVASACIGELTTDLEYYRIQEIKNQNILLQQKPKPLTEQQRAEAIQFLQNENLLELTINNLQLSGIIGEEINSMILFIAMTSRKTHDPISVICLAKSGTGKSYLMERVANCIPDEDKQEHTQFSGNSFYYYKREEIRGKVFLIEDLEGAQDVLFPIRELQTKKRISKTVTIKDKNGQLKTVTLIVEGPVSVIGCTTKERIYEDNANRAILIYLDNSTAQDEKIMTYQKNTRAGLIDTYQEKQIQNKLQHIQKVLEPIKVINPYAPLIDLPKEVFKPRRALPMLLSFIEAITFYHQHQRTQHTEKESGEIFIETTPGDIQHGFNLLSDTLFRKSDELSGATRSFYELLKRTVTKEVLLKFRTVDVRAIYKIPPRTLSRYFNELAEYGYIHQVGGKKATGYEYELLANTSEQQLQESINTQIKTIMDNIQQEHHKRIQKESSTPVSQRKPKQVLTEANTIE